MDEKYSNFKVADLKRELKSKGLPTTGNKKELLERLGAKMEDTDTGTEEDIIPDGETSDVDDVIASEEALLEEAALVEVSGTDLLHSTSIDIDSSLLEKDLTLADCKPSSPLPTAEDVPKPPPTTAPEPKKISLNRDSNVVCNKENVEKPAEKKIISINKPVSATEKLQDRASRFGIKTTDMTEGQKKKLREERFTSASNGEDAKVARQDRFGAVTSPLSNTTKTFSSASDSDDIIKKRQERFGVVTSSVKRSVEGGDSKQKRLQRFGTIGSPVSNSSDDEKKKQRAQRFVSST